ncbi:D-3-phosphoglycerate dehydrogenase, chloroplastic [Hordeum vulgare]|nr:D-3-phosphoglycerate dehydrogenase, chloroplastic [Hordeum vulgare]
MESMSLRRWLWGKALEAQLPVPVHSLRVTAHHPEHFFVIFTQPAHQVNVVRRGSIRVDGACFNIVTWHKHDHATSDSLLLHVRVVIEKVPMHFSSVEGAEEILGRQVRVDRLDRRTLERGHTKTFACWVWARDVADIPTLHTLGVLPHGAGRVEEMEGVARDTGSDTAATQAAPVARSNTSGKDPVEDFFRTAKKPTIASVIVDGLAANVHIAAEAAVAAPLKFDEAPLLQGSCEAVQLDAFSPTLSAAVSNLGQFHRATPSPAKTMEVQLGAVTGRVSQLEIGEAVARPESRSLFRATKQPLIGTTPARRPAAPPKTRATSTPTRSSARQAANGSSVPVAHRASLRLVKELGLLGPRDKMTEDVARALLHRFNEPLSDSDISVIARLTRLDSEVLRVMARMTGPDGAADEATV